MIEIFLLNGKQLLVGLAGCDELFSVLTVSLEGLVGVFREVFDDGVAEVVVYRDWETDRKSVV